MFTIGEFSKIAGLTIKTLRFYHEEGLLVPSFVDPQTGYRYYDETQIETARTITFLRSLEFPLSEIKEALTHAVDDRELLRIIERQRDVLQGRIRHFKKAVRALDRFVTEEREAANMTQSAFEIEEKVLEPMLIAGVRMKARYADCGKGFGLIGRNFGRHICGKPFLLHYDTEYKEADADFEACMPARQEKAVQGISMRRLDGGRCVSLLHKGPYDELGRSYARILKYVKERGYRIIMPTREVYIKGPGMIFRGNPKNYLTEIQMVVADGADAGA